MLCAVAQKVVVVFLNDWIPSARSEARIDLPAGRWRGDDSQHGAARVEVEEDLSHLSSLLL